MFGFLKKLWLDRCGNVLTIFAISLPLMIGGLGLSVEGANWYQTKRALQNAADEAVVAAATNNTSTYQSEARAVTAKYGFTNGSSNVTVTASNAATCPDGTTTCYSVTITKKLELLFLPIFGFTGNSTIGTAGAELISSTAVASFQTSPRNYCILALAGSAPSVSAVEFLTNGAPKADLAGCSVMSNASMDCNGHDLNADYGDAHGTASGCGKVQELECPRGFGPVRGACIKYPGPRHHVFGRLPPRAVKEGPSASSKQSALRLSDLRQSQDLLWRSATHRQRDADRNQQRDRGP